MKTKTEPRAQLPRSAMWAFRRARDAGMLLKRRADASRRRDGRKELSRTSMDAPPIYYGWTRFSALMPKKHGLQFRASWGFPDADAYAEYLWSEARMAERAAIFLDRSAPLLQAMSERHDYRHVVTYSPEMPEPWLSMLQEAATRHAVLDLRPVSDGPVTQVMMDELQEQEGNSRPAVWFRLDDDDLLSVDYLDSLDHHVRAHGPMWGVSFGLGYQGLWDNGRVRHVRSTHRPLSSHGQACIGWWNAPANKLTVPGLGSHTGLDRRVPTVLDSRSHMFLRLVHPGQDTRSEAPPTREELRVPLLRSKAVVKDHAKFLRLFPSLVDVYDADA